ncbi:hypothetical protein A8F26_33645 [Burkholderia cenocepacia]|nr:hypothetical protein A8F16_29985 [Burkholderia cenocepacia]ONX72251.1 hypothetical protein A8F17_06200 [Burkholderia cenocepacia]ONX76432.1 hypothetical protein A8F18_31025 [Burkholderia cenocepacia]ONX82049.1 hypothetical protein A8F14_03900 [Burkholderia cenocepacia]ONX89253.1 hypothetical protein A8F26_33645 [Burkholderia cenocepacia]
MSSGRNSADIRVCTGLTRAFRSSGALHPSERFTCDRPVRSVKRNFFEIHPVEQNSKLTRRNMAG